MKSFDVLYMLTGWLVHGKNGWRTTTFSEENSQDAFGDRLRVEATACLFHSGKAPLVVVSGSAGRIMGGAPPGAEIAAHELEELGVPAGSIVSDAKSGSTFAQLITLAAMAAKRNWRCVMVVSNRYHLSRVRAMIECAEPLSFLAELSRKGDLVLQSAEEVLLESGDDWKRLILQAYESERMQEIIAKEEQGVRDIRAGHYRIATH